MKLIIVDSNCLNVRLPEVERVAGPLLTEPSSIFVFPDVILGEQVAPDTWRNILGANLSSWIPHVNRVLPGRHFSELLDMERDRRAPLRRGQIIHWEKV